MCGILMVRSSRTLDHTLALKILQRRGPDFTVTKQIGNTFIAQTVLHITGSNEFYHAHRADGFAYNGEIYDYRWFGNWNSDTELAYYTAKERPKNFKYFEGPWAWCYVHDDTLTYASDPQGERCLYHYQDADIHIVSSEVAVILCYIDAQPQQLPYKNKCWTMIKSTPWQGITRCEPGRLYKNGQPDIVIDSIFNWIDQPRNIAIDEAIGEFENIWQHACTIIRPAESATLSYSGGIDSELVAKYVGKLNLLAIDIIGKDPIVESLQCPKIRINEQQWAEHYHRALKDSMMPLQSWSHVGKWLVSKHSSDRIIFTGLGADELFGGYNVYQNIDYTDNGSTSPYSSNDHDNLWHHCLHACHGDPRPATLLMDYWYQVIGVDAPGQDLLGGCWGKETRNPFLLKSVMKFALNLPWHLRVGQYPKQLLREFYQRKIFQVPKPKQGFAGHANDSLPWLGVNIQSTGSRQQDWQQIAQQTFYAHYQAH